MSKESYSLRYLPLFYNDLEEHVMYLTEVLCNPCAANELLDAVEKAILGRLSATEAFEQYHSWKERRHPYYRIYVKDYTIYYVVIPDGKTKIMEVRRILHNLQDRGKYI